MRALRQYAGLSPFKKSPVPRRARGRLLVVVVTLVLGVLGLIAIALPQYRTSALLIACGIGLALLRAFIFKDVSGRSAHMRSRHLRASAHQNSRTDVKKSQ